MSHRTWLRAALVLGLITFSGAGGARGQLRPLDPLDWRTVGFEGRAFSVGSGLYAGQRASLAGLEGRLVEVGSFTAHWGLGQVSVEVSGTPLLVFDGRSAYTEPLAFVPSDQGLRRVDAGDLRVTTVILLTPPEQARAMALRFGVRLPTTDNLKGLDRDQTDFFALLAGRFRRTAWDVGWEVGMGVYGTRDTHNEQVDPILFGLSALYDMGRARAVLELAGHHDPRAGPDQRGNEDLGEARLGVRVGGDRWMQLSLVRGWTPSSPDLGATIRFGTLF